MSKIKDLAAKLADAGDGNADFDLIEELLNEDRRH